MEYDSNCPLRRGGADDRCCHPVRRKWLWQFAVNVPVAAVVLLLAQALPQFPDRGRKIDRASATLSVLGFAAFTLDMGRITTTLMSAATYPACRCCHQLRGTGSAGDTALRPAGPIGPPTCGPIPCLDGRLGVLLRRADGELRGSAVLPAARAAQGDLATGLAMTPWPLVVAIAGPLSGLLAEECHTGCSARSASCAGPGGGDRGCLAAQHRTDALGGLSYAGRPRPRHLPDAQ